MFRLIHNINSNSFWYLTFSNFASDFIISSIINIIFLLKSSNDSSCYISLPLVVLFLNLLFLNLLSYLFFSVISLIFLISVISLSILSISEKLFFIVLNLSLLSNHSNSLHAKSFKLLQFFSCHVFYFICF